MENKLEKFVIDFFSNLKCVIKKDGDVLVVDLVPKIFEELYGKNSPYKFSFNSKVSGAEFIDKQNYLISSISRFLENSGKTTVLRIDFGENFNFLERINKSISFKNLEISNISKKNKNNFFSRFTFKTFFHYLNESEQVVSEIYVHEGKIVRGDLTGYKVLEWGGEDISADLLSSSYKVAKEELKNTSEEKINSIGAILEGKLDEEIKRVEEHYSHLINELGGDITEKLEKINKLEVEFRTIEDLDEREKLKVRLERLRKSLVNVGNDSAKEKIVREKDFTIKDIMHKYSLNVENKLVNTTIIYYPVYTFNLNLKKGRFARNLEIIYDPLLDSLSEVFCESCRKKISLVNVCFSGHLSCSDCLDKCYECNNEICSKCLVKSCKACAKKLCKNCVLMCLGCGSYSCRDHFRKDNVTGEDRCVNCLRACLRCHNLTNEKMFGKSMDGSKVCLKCLGDEKRKGIMKDVFRD